MAVNRKLPWAPYPYNVIVDNWTECVMQGSACWVAKNITGRMTSTHEDEDTGYGPLTFSFEKESDAVLFALRWVK
jgi:hypothetical protein